jgi:hypothetical protein
MNVLRLNGMILRLSFLVLALATAGFTAAHPARAGELQMRDLPRATESSVSNISFTDAPKRLPIDTRFSQAIQTIAFNLNLSCRQIEAYGWTLSPSEQTRVDAIFTDAATQLANAGYTVKPQNPAAAAEDITVYTATQRESPTDHLLFMWSAGDAGLLLLLCDAKGSAEPAATNGNATRAPALPENVPYVDSNPTRLVGEWMGRYTCRSQGPTSATLTITKAHMGTSHDDHRLDGVFSFYPSPDNPGVAAGSYRVMGTYDDATQQATFSPGAWQQQPIGYTSHPFIAYFDLQRERVSMIFQETTGCTSFEAGLKSRSTNAAEPAKKPAKKKKKAVKKKPTTATVTEAPAETPVDVPVDAPAAETLAPLDTSAPSAPTEASAEAPAPTPATPAAPADVVTVPETKVDVAAPTAPAPVSPAAPTPAPSTPTPSAPIAAEPTPSELVVPVKPAAIPAPAAPTVPTPVPASGVIDVAPTVPATPPAPASPPANPNVNQTFGGLAVPPAKPIQPAQ